MNILIIEDEALAYEKLEEQILQVSRDATITWKRDIKSIAAFLKNNQPDIIFSDIQLTEGTVFEVFDKVDISCPIIFCTAYNTYYQNAFSTYGIAYLLKPYTQSEFLNVWEKYTVLFDNKPDDILYLKKQLQAVFKPVNYSSSLTVKKRDGYHIIPLETIIYIQSKGDFAIAYDVYKNFHILSYTMNKLEGLLDPSQFFRINRSEIVSKSHVLRYTSHIKSRLKIILRTTPEKELLTSNSKATSFKRWLST